MSITSFAKSSVDACSLLKTLRAALIALRSDGVTQPIQPTTTSDQAPAFLPLISDPQMQSVLASRWGECVACISANAPLSATVMMGGLLEAVLLARINRESNRRQYFRQRLLQKTRPANQNRYLSGPSRAILTSVMSWVGFLCRPKTWVKYCGTTATTSTRSNNCPMASL